MQTRRVLSSFLCLLCLSIVAGCFTSSEGPSPQGKAVRLDTEPAGAQDIVDFKNSLITGLNPGGEAILVGRVGSGAEAWDANQATFLMSDLNFASKAHDAPDSDHAANCKFCQTENAKELESMALVRIIDESGKVISQDAKTLLGVKENQVVVAQGSGTIADDGALVFDASKVFVRTSN